VKNKLLIIGILLISFSVAGLCMRRATVPMGSGDSGHYLAMARHPGTFVGSPWGYRIAVPYVAASISSLTGVPVETAYTVLQVGMFSLFLTALFLWLSWGFGISTFAASMACLLFIFSYPGVYNLHNVTHVGLGEHLLVLLGCIALYHNRFLFFVCVVAASCLVKESVGMLLIPSFLVLALMFENWRGALLKTAVVAAVYVSLHLGLRSGILFHERIDLGTYASFYTWEYVRFVHNYWGGGKGAAFQIAFTFGPAWLLAFTGVFIAPRRLKALAIVPLLAALQIALATDVGRMVGVGAPVLMALAAFALSRLDKKRALLLVGLSCLYFLCYNHGVGTKPGFIVSVALTSVILWRSRAAFGAQTSFADIR
jgi:hypothetical protein